MRYGLVRNRRLAYACVSIVAGTALLLNDPSSRAARAPAAQERVLRHSAVLAAAVLPSNFQETTVFAGLANPTALRFAPDGRIFVAEKSGLIKVFDSLSASTPTVFADLRGEVDNYWDRGLLGMALDPNFPTTPFVYVLYTYDARIGGTAPLWSDACPTPPGPTTDGCVVSGRLSRLQASGNTMTGSEQVMIEDWCQQFPSHSIGDLHFGPDGKLYVSGGDGASFNNVDYGQYGGSAGSPTPKNPCGDPPAGVGGNETPPSAEGGALRSQSYRRPAAEPVTLDGTVLRVDPATGAGLPDNPLGTSSDANARRIVAAGFRNPFRFTFRPGTSELWVGDVGWNTWEEIDRSTTISNVQNYGWPCYEGVGTQGGYQSAGLNLCSTLPAAAVNSPYYTYNHSAQVVAGETCPTGSSSITGLAFYTGGSYPSSYNGALFFADHSRNCIWVMYPGADGLPDPAQRATFVAPAAGPVDLEIGPGGDLFYVDYDGGTIRRIRYTGANNPPTARASASPTTGSAPLTVAFDGTASSDPDPGDTISYSWDLNGDGIYGDATTATTSYTYSSNGTYAPRLTVTDTSGASSTSDPITITVGNTPPSATITSPSASYLWRVGDVISFSGSASDAQDGQLPASALSWTIILHHCPSNCHEHIIQTIGGVSSGTFTAPDHEYPSYLEIRLTATDSDGLTNATSVSLDPQTVSLSFNTSPGGLTLGLNGTTASSPFTRTVIAGSTNTISAPLSQMKNKVTYRFASWSDGGAATHSIKATTSMSFSAKYRR
jgi:glucose/arabinose dehydrogenase